MLEQSTAREDGAQPTSIALEGHHGISPTQKKKHDVVFISAGLRDAQVLPRQHVSGTRAFRTNENESEDKRSTCVKLRSVSTL